MKVAIIGSRTLEIANIGDYLPPDTTEIVSGGAKGVDTSAKKFALENGYKYTEFLPEYSKYRRSAPLKRNEKMVEYADCVLAFWDGKSRGTKYTVTYAEKIQKKTCVVTVSE